MVQINKRGILIIFFLFLNENICCGYSLEAPPQGASNDYPEHKFSWRNKKTISTFRLTYLRLFYKMFHFYWPQIYDDPNRQLLISFLYNLPIKMKREKNRFLQIEVFQFVDYKTSFWSSVTRGKSDWWSVITDRQWQHYFRWNILVHVCISNSSFDRT